MANQKSLNRLLRLIALLKQEPPKSIQYLADFMKTSNRTVYRYLQLLEDVGFNIEADKFNKYCIEDNQLIAPSNFNQEELTFLKELLLTSGRSNKLYQSIIHKLSLNSDLDLVDHDIYNARLANLINLINQSININKQVIIKQYQSINSQRISDRLVEPIKFTANYRSLCAFEIETQQNKFFNLERMGNVEITHNDQAFESQHQFSKPDAFGFSYSGDIYKVSLELDLKAMLLLTEEYPLTRPKVKKTEDNCFLFSTEIYNPKPLQRFYRGLTNNIKVLEETTINLKR